MFRAKVEKESNDVVSPMVLRRASDGGTSALDLRI